VLELLDWSQNVGAIVAEVVHVVDWPGEPSSVASRPVFGQFCIVESAHLATCVLNDAQPGNSLPGRYT